MLEKLRFWFWHQLVKLRFMFVETPFIQACVKLQTKNQHRPFTTNSLTNFRNQLGHLSVVIIDEISMVGFRMLNCIHQRLLEQTQSKEDFGCLSIISGDLFQLPPVHDCHIFQFPYKEYLLLTENLWLDHFTMYELK